MGNVQRDIEELERNLLMRSVGALSQERSLCVDCGRTPLTGEHVHFYDRHPGDAAEMVCELCAQLRREAPAASELVRHSEHGQTVRLTVRAA